MLLHDSGEYIESWAQLPPLSQGKNMNAAHLGVTLPTCAARIPLALLNLSVDEDTDGTVKQKSSNRVTEYDPKPCFHMVNGF